jgi:hypothetical protein
MIIGFIVWSLLFVAFLGLLVYEGLWASRNRQ